MRRWFIYLIIAAGIYLLYRMGGRKEARSPLGKRLKETISVLVWALLTVYVLAFLYWVYTRIFK
ncbi:MAG: hypothetical protein JXB23_05655 [Candidatus Aminicenantes bacterium]|nr:hypothetical protein [Candidatus Aminicenantes bacterium]